MFDWSQRRASSSIAFIRYVASVDQDQLLGSTSTSTVDDDCTPLVYNGTLVLHPCGLIANTLFNDIFVVTSNHTMDETGIAWASDVEDKVSWVLCLGARCHQAEMSNNSPVYRPRDKRYAARLGQPASKDDGVASSGLTATGSSQSFTV